MSAENDPEIVLRLPLSVVQAIVTFLAAHPYVNVVHVLNEIYSQAAPQITDAQADAAANAGVCSIAPSPPAGRLN
jgi:predicted metal-dependent peptidase